MTTSLNSGEKMREMMMSDIGLFNSRYEISQKCLDEFDKSLFLLLQGRKSELSNANVDGVVRVLEAIAQHLCQTLTSAEEMDESSILSLLRLRAKGQDWERLREGIPRLSNQLRQGDKNLSAADLAMLNDIGDALNYECSKYFRRTRGF
jgi:uncharacterized protein YukE